MDIFAIDVFPFSCIDDNDFEKLVNDFGPEDNFSLDILNNLEFIPTTPVDPLAITNTYEQSLFVSSKYTFLEDLKGVNTEKNFNILNFNIRSVPANLQLFLDVCFHEIPAKIDVLTLCESRLDDSIANLYKIPGYNMFHQPRSRDGGGVCVFILDTYLSHINDSFCFTETYLECVGVEVKHPQGLILVISVYRPPKGNLRDFIVKIGNLLDHISTMSYKAIYLCGDWNLDLLKVENSPLIKEFVTIMYSNSFFPTINKPKRVGKTAATIIDNIWSSKIEKNASNHIFVTDLTDHYPIFSQFSIENSGNVNRFIMKRSFTDRNIDNFVADMNNTDWSNVYDENDSNEAYNVFFRKFKTIFDRNFPIKKIRCKR